MTPPQITITHRDEEGRETVVSVPLRGLGIDALYNAFEDGFKGMAVALSFSIDIVQRCFAHED